MGRKLSNRKEWKDYWSEEKIKFLLKRKPYFSQIIEEYTAKLHRRIKFIEIGGFPGIYSYYFAKNFNFVATLLDFYIDRSILSKVAEHYKLKANNVKTIEKDFLKYNTKVKYDLVYSSGFIEHFEDSEKILKKHINLLNKGGKAVITLPNFLGINGFLQNKFDNENYKAHNIKIMDIRTINSVLSNIGVKNYKVFYYGNSGIWFENLEHKVFYLRLLVYLFYVLKFPLKLLNIETKSLSPHIVIVTEK